MITRELLIERGYGHYAKGISSYSTGLYQKRVNGRTRNGAFVKRYFINFDEFDFSDIPNYSGSPLRYESSVQFETRDGFTLDVRVHTQEHTLDAIEAKIEEIFCKLEGIDYERD